MLWQLIQTTPLHLKRSINEFSSIGSFPARGDPSASFHSSLCSAFRYAQDDRCCFKLDVTGVSVLYLYNIPFYAGIETGR
jgi:hypothetical protein